MAKTKITALTELTDTNIAIGDLIPIVDISDTSQAASGTTKKVTITSLATAVASAFSGDSPTFVNLNTTGTTTLGDSGDATTVNGTLGVTGVATFTDNIVMASGKGIDFSATANSSGTMTSELLSDYEEGTFTPVLTSTGATFPSGTYAGKYTKIGNLVTFQLSFDTNASPTGTLTNALTITGLPFTASLEGYGVACPVAFQVGVTPPANAMMLTGRVTNATTSIELGWFLTTGQYTETLASQINTADSRLVVSGSYQT